MQVFFSLFYYFLECPVAVTENSHSLAVLADGIDVHTVAADHKILVDHRVVDAQLAALFQGTVVVILAVFCAPLESGIGNFTSKTAGSMLSFLKNRKKTLAFL